MADAHDHRIVIELAHLLNSSHHSRRVLRARRLYTSRKPPANRRRHGAT
jgi:hypothetical protein